MPLLILLAIDLGNAQSAPAQPLKVYGVSASGQQVPQSASPVPGIELK